MIPSVDLKYWRLFNCSKQEKHTFGRGEWVDLYMSWIIYLNTLVEKTMRDESVSGQNSAVVFLHWLSATVSAFVLY